MIEKTLHCICVLAAGALFSALLLLIYQLAFFYCYQIDIMAPQTYASIRNYWDDGGVLKAGDLFMLIGIFSYFPLNHYFERHLPYLIPKKYPLHKYDVVFVN